ncbi:MAG: hypothetical protein HeimC3_50130 [Candidatus Heimdallarchaeota archaeon LC_3]|nr:MAG: hypothetical protein HeimC3_50130 [Candidatus Heimdallarchaeota archaeon LC_3]
MDIFDFITIFGFITGGSIFGGIMWYWSRRNKKYHGSIVKMIKQFNKHHKDKKFSYEVEMDENLSEYEKGNVIAFIFTKTGIYGGKAINERGYLTRLIFHEGKGEYEEKYIECTGVLGRDLTSQENSSIEEFLDAIRSSHFKNHPKIIKFSEKEDIMLKESWRLY